MRVLVALNDGNISSGFHIRFVYWAGTTLISQLHISSSTCHGIRFIERRTCFDRSVEGALWQSICFEEQPVAVSISSVSLYSKCSHPCSIPVHTSETSLVSSFLLVSWYRCQQVRPLITEGLNWNVFVT
jgi:hypothetical protein